MYLAKVTGALVSTTKHASLNGSKLLIVARLDENYQPTVHAQVAVDTVGAGNGEIVIITTWQFGAYEQQQRSLGD